MNGHRWIVEPQDAARSRDLAAALGLPAPLAQVLLNRGCPDASAAERFLRPRLSDLTDPFEVAGMRQACDRVTRAVAEGRRIAVFGDYDVDGVSATALAVTVLRALGADARPFLPSRMEEGYGLGIEALDRCLDRERPGLLLTVDCGTNSAEAVARAADRGVDVVVTDHHETGGGARPAAAALVNPHLGAPEAAASLSGVGVAFKLCHALVRAAREAGRPAGAALDLRAHLDLVALGTIADIVPLRGENRILARHGLERLGRTASPGLAALAGVAGVRPPVEAHHVGFMLGPRLNAAGRLGTAERALELLLTADPARAAALAGELDAANRSRQELERATVEDAVGRAEALLGAGERFTLVVAAEGWHPGVIGIVASRLVQRYARPAIVIATEGASGRGSGRSIEGFDLVAGLAACADLLDRHGGHAMAAGLQVRADRLEAFARRFEETARARLSPDDLRPVQRIDAWIGLEEADRDLLARQQDLAPFGCGNPRPLWAARGVRVVGEPRVVGRGERPHLKLLLADGGAQREAIGFELGPRRAELPAGPMDVVFQLQANTYGGAESLQLNLRDFRPPAA